MILSKWFEQIPPYRLTALRVLIACSIAVGVTHLLGIERSYWAILAIISVTVSINIGDMISRSRVLATLSVLGCIIGTFLFYWCDQWLTPNQMVMMIIVVALVYLYAIQIHYPIGVLINCIFLVMFIGVLSSWDLSLLWTRIIDVMIGVISMIVVSYVIRGRHHKGFALKKVEVLINDHGKIIENIDDMSVRNIEEMETRQAEVIKALYQLRYDFPSKRDYYKMRDVVVGLEDLLLSYYSYIGLRSYREQHAVIYEEMKAFCRQKMQRQFDKVSNKLQNILQ